MRPPRELIDHAERLFDRAQVDEAIDRVAVRVQLALADLEPLVVCLMNGALPFTAELIKRLQFPLQLDYIYATRYVGSRGGDLQVADVLKTDPRGRHVLVVDDILDRGATMRAVCETLQAAGAASVRTAVLVDKQIAGVAERDISATFVGLEAPDQYLVGCGMDYNGWFRNLTEIYALRAEDIS